MDMVKKILFAALSLVLSCSLFTTHMNAAAEFGLDFNSRYIFRGFDLNPNNKPVLQPSITFVLGKSGLSVNVWGSFSFEDKALHETDITLSYDFTGLKNVSLSVGFIHYGWYFSEDFTFKANTTQEFYLTAGLPNVPLKPTLSLYYDINNGDGFFASLGIGHGLRLSEGLTLDLSASLNYNGGQWIEGSGFSHFDFVASVPVTFGKISISPFVGAVLIMMEEVNPGVDHEVYVGVSLAF